MRPREAALVDPTAIHTRSGKLLVKKPQQRASEVAVVEGGLHLNAKSLLTLMKAGTSSGDRIPNGAERPDDVEAVEGLAAPVASFSE